LIDVVAAPPGESEIVAAPSDRMNVGSGEVPRAAVGSELHA
jgi:hypothetical protein